MENQNIKIKEEEVIHNFLNSKNKCFIFSCPIRFERDIVYAIQHIEEHKTEKFLILISLQ